MASLVQYVHEAYERERTTWIARGECVRISGQVLVKLPQCDSLVCSNSFQSSGGSGSIDFGEGAGEGVGDPGSALASFFGPSIVSGPFHWPGRRMVVLRARGAGGRSSPTALLTWALIV